MADTTASPTASNANFNSVTNSDIPLWYQDYTKSIANQASDIYQQNASQPVPVRGIAGLNPDQISAFDMTRGSVGNWQPQMTNAAGQNGQISPMASKLIDYAQGTVGAPAVETGAAMMPWAQGAQDAASGSAQAWTDPGTVSKYMSPYTSQVVDNISRLGQRNWENTIMPGVNSSMIGSGQFGSTRNADILSRAGVQAANDITGQQSTALQAGYMGGAGIFANDAQRAQAQQQLQAQTALAGGNMMQGALSADANRVQAQGQLQSQVALSGANGGVNALNTSSTNAGALAKSYQQLANTDSQSILNIGNQQQTHQQNVLDADYTAAQQARNDPWSQLGNMTSAVSGTKLPTSVEVSSSGTQGVPPNTLSTVGSTLLTGANMIPS